MGSNKQSVLVGDKFINNQASSFIVIKYEHARKITIEFQDDYGYQLVAAAYEIKNGQVKNPYAPSVCGVGYIGVGRFKVTENKRMSVEYGMWKSMIRRCYDDAFKKRTPSYLDCFVHSDWHNFQVFAEWLNSKDYSHKNYHLDKDLLVAKNKVYSSDTCVLIPARLNSLLLRSEGKRGSNPIGVSVSADGVNFVARVNINGKTQNIGTYKNKVLAHKAYAEEKERYVKTLAEEFKAEISADAYQALINWRVRLD